MSRDKKNVVSDWPHVYLQLALNKAAASHWSSTISAATEKVVTAVWGTECIQFHAALQILHQKDLRKEITLGLDASEK